MSDKENKERQSDAQAELKTDEPQAKELDVKDTQVEPELEVAGKEEADSDTFSFDATSDDLPEDIKQKLERNKAARAKKQIKKKKKKVAKTVKSGNAYIQATYNNTIVTLTDNKGDVISWASAGVAGFRGAKKSTPYAAQIITKIAATKAKEEYGLAEVNVYVSGVGTGRESAIRALNANGLEVISIKDTTAVPHNGCRPKKPRRV